MTQKISRDRFCINRKIAPNLTVTQFFTLVKDLGINKVEIRNDMKSGSVTDGLGARKFVNWQINMR